ncbi:MAG: hypothetical protein NXI15_00245 [Gammaproteobacteria bacterium]|nr:hypothetical protein [Gammaproteobacteria bacterium]
MSDPFSLQGFLVALLLPWFAGTVWVKYLLARTGRINWYIVIGQGFFVGYFATTLLVRAWDAAGQPLNFSYLGTALLTITLVGLALLRTASFPPAMAPEERAVMSPLVKLGVVVLLGMLGWRYLLLFEELLLRPLYAWDAWMNWAPKSIVWFHVGEITDFVSPKRWMSLGSLADYTLGNGQAWDYPISVPVIILWNMLGAGTWDHPALFLPWMLMPVCLGMAIYGHLRLAGVSVALSVLACYVLLSIPYVNVHSVLAGYADLWLASAFGLGVCAIYEFARTRHWAYALLALFLAGFCAQLKVPGIFMGLILLVCVVRTAVNLPARIEMIVAAVLFIAFVLLLMVGISFEAPHLGTVVLSWEEMRVGRVGNFVPKYHHVESEFFETYFLMANWHLLAYYFFALVLYGLGSGVWWRWPSSEALAAVTALVFVVSVFFFTGYFTQAKNFVALNRALLYPVPALIFCFFLHFPWRALPARTRGSLGI